MSVIRETSKAIRMTAILWVLTALIYPGIILAIGLIFPYQANGSLIKEQGKVVGKEQEKVVGSALIGQTFSSEKYFLSRPSANNYSSLTPDELKQMEADLKIEPKNKEDEDKKSAAENKKTNIAVGTSGASNLAPSNTKELLKDDRKPDDADLLKRIKSDAENLQKAGIKPTADLVYTSGSGLDPHISKESADAQIDRIAKVRALTPNQVQALVVDPKYTDDRFLGIFGEPGINVLKLNLALDALQATK